MNLLSKLNQLKILTFFKDHCSQIQICLISKREVFENIWLYIFQTCNRCLMYHINNKLKNRFNFNVSKWNRFTVIKIVHARNKKTLSIFHVSLMYFGTSETSFASTLEREKAILDFELF